MQRTFPAIAGRAGGSRGSRLQRAGIPNVVVIMFYVELRANGDQMTAWMEKLIAPLQCSPLLWPDKFQHSISQSLIGNRWASGPAVGSGLGGLRRAFPGSSKQELDSQR